MAKRKKSPLLGITLATPALTMASPSQASIAPSSVAQSSVADSQLADTGQARLKAELLGLDRAEKIRIAGDRVRVAAAQTLTGRTPSSPTYVGCVAQTSRCCVMSMKPAGAHPYQTGTHNMSAAHTCGCPGVQLKTMATKDTCMGKGMTANGCKPNTQ